MDKKYIGKTLVLPKETAATLAAVQEQLMKEFGFKPSLSECVSYLVQFWTQRQSS